VCPTPKSGSPRSMVMVQPSPVEDALAVQEASVDRAAKSAGWTGSRPGCISSTRTTATSTTMPSMLAREEGRLCSMEETSGFDRYDDGVQTGTSAYKSGAWPTPGPAIRNAGRTPAAMRRLKSLDGRPQCVQTLWREHGSN